MHNELITLTFKKMVHEHPTIEHSDIPSIKMITAYRQLTIWLYPCNGLAICDGEATVVVNLRLRVVVPPCDEINNASPVMASQHTRKCFGTW